jgi:hypothetical protein
MEAATSATVTGCGKSRLDASGSVTWIMVFNDEKTKRGQAALCLGKPEWRDFTPHLRNPISVELLFFG